MTQFVHVAFREMTELVGVYSTWDKAQEALANEPNGLIASTNVDNPTYVAYTGSRPFVKGTYPPASYMEEDK